MNQSTDNLQAALEAERASSLVRQAKTIRDWPDGPQRAEEAQTLIRTALVSWATGRISQATESQLYTPLNFAMPGEGVTIDGESAPLSVREEEAEWERLYQQQLDQRTCPECGDGACPTNE